MYYWLLYTAERNPLEFSCLKEAATQFWDCNPIATYFRNVTRDFASILAHITCELTGNPNSNTEMDQIKYKGKMTNNLSPNITWGQPVIRKWKARDRYLINKMSSGNAVSCTTELFQKSIRNKAEASWKQQVTLFCLLHFHWAKEQRVNKKFREKMQRLVQNPFSFKISETHQPEALTLCVSLSGTKFCLYFHQCFVVCSDTAQHALAFLTSQGS